jgi:hypothetical protein
MGGWIQIHAFLTSASDGDDWSATQTSRLRLWKEPLAPTEQEVGCHPEPVCTFWRKDKSLTPVEIQTPAHAAYNPVA